MVSLKIGYLGHVVCGSGSPHASQIIEGKVEGRREADRGSSGMITSRNGKDLHKRRLKDWHRIEKALYREMSDVQRWSPIAIYDGGSQVGKS